MNKLLLILFVSLAFSLPVQAKKGDKEGGHGAGGLRDDYASESGLEHGKAWAGSNEGHDGEGPQAESGDKQKQEKKQKKKNK